MNGNFDQNSTKSISITITKQVTLLLLFMKNLVIPSPWFLRKSSIPNSITEAHKMIVLNGNNYVECNS